MIKYLGSKRVLVPASMSTWMVGMKYPMAGVQGGCDGSPNALTVRYDSRPAHVANVANVIAVNPNFPAKDYKEFLAVLKANPGKYTFASPGAGSLGHVNIENFMMLAKIDLLHVPYKGGGRVAKELAGKNADSTVNNPSEQLGFYQAGKTVALGAFTPTRLPLFPDAPTFKELGKDFVYFMQRTVVGAPGMSKGAAAYYQGLFKKIFNAKDWQGYMKKKSLQGEFLTGDALMKYWMREKAVQKALLQKMGAI